MSLAKLLLSSQQKILLNHGFSSIKALSPVCISQVRFRKPKWMGRASSKEGIYFNKPQPSENDLKKAEVMYQKYNALLQSIVAALQEEVLLKEQQNTTMYGYEKWNEAAHHEKCMAYIKKENENMALARKERLNQIMKDQMMKDQEENDLLCQQWLKKEKDFIEDSDAVIEESKNWVNIDNLEKKILYAIENPINFNFAVQKSGMIKHRTYLP